jgi:CheY-like chemotaxis protein
MTTARNPAPLRVLIIEDVFLIALDLETALRHLGFEMIERAATVAQAVDAAAWWEPHLLTVDLNLPDGSGLDAARAIQARDGGIVAVYITGNPELLATEPEAIVLAKPFGDIELRGAVERALTAVAAI